MPDAGSGPAGPPDEESAWAVVAESESFVVLVGASVLEPALSVVLLADVPLPVSLGSSAGQPKLHRANNPHHAARFMTPT
jgi:hypothetical protein